MSDPSAPADPWDYGPLARLMRDQPLPAMVVDLDLLEGNARRLAGVASAAGKTLRVASKSVRVPSLLRRIIKAGAPTIQGLMCFSAQEAAFLHGQGFDDLLIAYPTVQHADLEALWSLRQAGADVIQMIDSVAHAERLSRWWVVRGDAGARSPTLPVCVDVDVSYRPLDGGPLSGAGLHLGVQRSPLRDLAAARTVLIAAAEAPALELRGLMAYEAQIAGLGEQNPFTPLVNPIKKLLKQRSIPDVAKRREALAAALRELGGEGQLFNGGGTGSIHSTSAEPWITEVTAGSGFMQSQLFDYYADNQCQPACAFALQVTRCPQPGLVTCQSGGFIASGEIAADKAPTPFRPRGLKLLKAEGCGEVQTPLRLPKGRGVALGDPIFFRPAKAGEIAERFSHYLLKRGGAIIGKARTYRGLGQCFY